MRNEKAAPSTCAASPNTNLNTAHPNTPRGASARPDLEIPTAEEVFDKPYPPLRVETPEAWTDPDSIAVELADRECARLIANALYDPPITEEEIAQYAQRGGISRADAESRIRAERRIPWES